MALWTGLTANWPLKLTSLLLALALWSVASFEEPSTRLIRIQLQVTPPEGRALVAPPATAQALVTGTERELLELGARPPILARAIADSVTARHVTLVLSPADVVLPRGIKADVRDVQPNEVTVELDSLYQRLVPVRASLLAHADSAPLTGIVTITPGLVRISGTVAAVRQVEAVTTVPFDLPGIADTNGLTVALDTTLARGVRVAPTVVTIRVRPAAR
ncbi:MAG TPA: hypothetical protein VFI39_11430 [Gemmatimonadales bacterium]|nr:hypothetical protein [Gemmatimonadales bacterium]